MTLMVTEKCALSQGKASEKLCGDLSLTLMGKTQKFSRGYYSGIVADCRYAVEAVGESEGFLFPRHAGFEDCSAPKRRCMSLNADNGQCFNIPRQVFSLSKMTGSEKKDLDLRLRRELNQVQKLQKKILLSNTVKLNGFAVSSSGDLLVKKQDHAGQNISQLNRGNSGGIEKTKQASTQPSITVLLKQCENLLKRLMAHQYAWVFNTPVNVEKLKIPDYFTVIKQPMDLGTVKSKVASGSYSSPLDFASDVRLTFMNAMTYNPPANDVHAMANVMSKFFEMRWKPIEKKAVAADAALKRVTKPAKPPLEPFKRKISQEYPVTGRLDSESKMLDEEKLSLSRRLSSIPELPQHIVDFLKQHTHNANQDSEYEIKVDFDSFSVGALFELKKLMDDCYREDLLQHPGKTVPCEIEVLNDSGLSNSSLHPCKGNGPAVENEDVDIGGNDPSVTSYSPFNRERNSVPKGSNGSGLHNSSSEPGTSSSGSDSGSTSSKSKIKVGSSPNSTKGNVQLLGATRHIKEPVIGPHLSEQDAHYHIEAVSVKANGNHKVENAPSERQVFPDKLSRAALLRSRFADTILKAREKTLGQGERRDPEKLRWEREELERQQREEIARLQAEAKAAEEARQQAEIEAAAEAKRRRELEREAARQALLRMEKTVDINESSLFLKDLEMLRTAADPIPGFAIERNPDCSNEGLDGFNLSGSNPLEQLGLFMKADDYDINDDDDDGGGVKLSMVPSNEAEEGEID